MAAPAGFAQMMAPVGPVAERFVFDEKFITAIMGPYGSAKTTSCIRKIVTSALWQDPSPVDGVRRVRWAVVRDTYQQLETNVMNSWFTWFPKEMGEWHGRKNCHTIRLQVMTLDGRPPETIEIEMYFRAMGDQKAEQVLKGLELTGLWLNEVDTLDRAVLRFGIGRVGRYPSAAQGGCQWSGIICDFNAPEIDNWTYELLVEMQIPIPAEQQEEMRRLIGPRFGIGFHRQPGGRSLDPLPENIQNLPRGYYELMMIGMTEADIRRFVDNEFGAVRNGQPVYPEYNDDFHCAKAAFKAVPDVPVGIGLDGGSTPAAVFGQLLPNGQRRTISEVVVFEDRPDERVLEKLGPTAFGEICGKHWAEHYGHCQLAGIWGDPAIWYGQDDDDYSWIKLFEAAFRKASGLRDAKVKPAPVAGNRLSPRLECVRSGLTQNAGGGQPGQLISPDCRYLRRGFNSGYVINRVALSNGTGRWKDEPDKNDFSHVHDAKQYLDLGLTKPGHTQDAHERGMMRRGGAQRAQASFGKGHFHGRAGARNRLRSAPRRVRAIPFRRAATSTGSGQA